MRLQKSSLFLVLVSTSSLASIQLESTFCLRFRKFAVDCRNSRAGAWSPARSKRFIEKRVDSPDPGTYNPSDTNSRNDNYILSKNRNLGCKILQQSKMEGNSLRRGKLDLDFRNSWSRIVLITRRLWSSDAEQKSSKNTRDLYSHKSYAKH